MEDLQNELAAMQLELQRMRDHAGQPAASVVIQREDKLRHFSGSGDVSLVDWLEEARACIVVQGLTGRAAANFAISYREGAARMEMRCQPDEVRSDADQIFLALEEVFGEKSSTSQLLRAFYERRQQISETISDFSHGLVELVDRLQRTSPGIADDRDRMLREQLIDNVRDVHLRWELKRRVEREPASTFLAIRKVAQRWADEVEDVPPKKMRAYVAQCDATPPDALAKVWDELAAQRKLFSEGLAAQQHTMTEVLKQQQQILSAMSSGPGPRPLGRPNDAGRGVECFHCHKLGHLRRDCRAYQRSTHAHLN